MRFILRHQKLWKAAILLLGCSLLFLCFHQKQKSRKGLLAIPFEDRFYLEMFFRALISEESGCYVLFGDKPAAMMVYEDRQDCQLLTLSRRPFSGFSKEKLGFKIWQKYRHLFPLRDYAIVNTRAFTPSSSEAVFLIHKERLLTILSQNFSEFQKRFPEFGTAKNLLDKMLGDASILHRVCFKHDMLLGIILGFGKDNAALFARAMQLESFLSPQSFICGHYRENPLTRPIPQLGFSSLEEELAAIQAKGDGIFDPNDEALMNWTLHFPLGFLVDTTKTDPKRLYAKYKQQRIIATRAYDKGNFLETTLRALTSTKNGTAD